MKTKKLLKIKIIALGICLIAPAIASAYPGIPHQFYGTVEFADGPAPDGTVVEAKIGVDVIVSAETKDGKYGYNDSGLFYVTDEGNNHGGATINFFVNDVDALNPITFVNGKIENLDLVLAGNAPTEGDIPTPPPVDPPAGSGGGGGGSGGSTGGDTTTNEEIVGDINGNSKVDKYDFALMMSAWGQTGSNLPADLNNDGKVDKYDFALLMLNWN